MGPEQVLNALAKDDQIHEERRGSSELETLGVLCSFNVLVTPTLCKKPCLMNPSRRQSAKQEKLRKDQ